MVAILAPLLATGSTLALAFIAMPVVLIGILSLLRWPGAGFPILIVASLLVPIRISTGTQTSINSAILVVGGLIAAWFFEMLSRDRQIRLLPSRIVTPSLLFILASILAFLFGQLPWYPTRAASLFAQLGGLSLFVLLVMTMLVALHRLSDIRWLKYSVWIFIILGAIYNLGFLVPFFRFYVNRLFQRAVVDSLFWLWLFALTFGQAYLNSSLPKGVRFALGLSAIAIFYNIFVLKQTWTSGWLPGVAAVGFIVLVTRPRLAIGIGLLIGVVGLLASNVTNSVIMGGDNEYSLVTRLEAWEILGRIIQLNPLFGLGPANYYFFTPFYNILGYSVSFNSHNNYIDIVAQIGLVGLILFFWIMAEIFHIGWKIRAISPVGFEKAFTYSVLGGVIGTLIAAMFGDWVIPFVYNVGMEGFRSASLGWFFMGGLAFLEVSLRAKTAIQSST
ncbi:MAG: O-antigen ligase family protein [Chloroflexota bacterium]